ncbi:arylamine N-acetyltransferase [Luteimonas sp. SJ-92]|uniref:Arylamine N-acetyltransferase n=1 Tax=Luteimonas salinisoli TaxID=2752307 RepID=A0A853JEX8_9GAMM|nr:arylamine N-acetyltransferase [Luteimonas salinisoli]NZA27159.1 arylamine N-acetyltransferase [Luteimonas salinisoli]
MAVPSSDIRETDPEHPSARWESAPLDLDGYLARIGHHGPLAPSLDTLRTLQAAHLDAIPFEGLDPYLGRPVPLDIESLQDKLVRRRRGGYCHEQNILFATVLDRLGFRVTGRSARMLMGADEREITEIGHTLLSVVIDGTDWHVDVGIGSAGPRGPIPLVEGGEFATGSWNYRIERSRLGHWLLRLRRAGGWFNLVHYTEERYYRADYADQNYVVATSPASPFVQRLIVQRNGADMRIALTDLVVTTHLPNGDKRTREIAPGQLPETLRSVFGLDLPGELERELVERAGRPRSSDWSDAAYGV